MKRRRVLIGVAAISFVVAAVFSVAGAFFAVFADEVDRPVAIAVTAALLAAAVAAGSSLALHLVDQRRLATRQINIEDRIEFLTSTVKPVHGLAQVQESLDTVDQRLQNLDSHLAKVERVSKKIASEKSSKEMLDRRLRDTSYQLYRQLEARTILEKRLEPALPLPPMRGFALSPDIALELVERILAGGVRTVLETGSGVSTLLMALAFKKRAGGGRVVALEHDARYAHASRRLLAEHGCADIAEVVLAPLVSQTVDGGVFEWYDLTNVDVEPHSVDLLLIDGPPASIGPRSRYPAVPLLRSTLTRDSRIVLDDANRPDERQIVEEWSERHGVELVAFHRHEKGSAELALVDGWSGPAPSDSQSADGAHEPDATQVDAAATATVPELTETTRNATHAPDMHRSGPARPLSANELPQSVWKEQGGERSSFMYKLHESKRRQRLLPLLGHRQRIWAHNDKMAGYRLARSLGLEVPETYERSVKIGDLDFASVPDRFVIKPHNGASNRGVFLLERTKTDTYRDLMDQRLKNSADVVKLYSELVANGLVSERLAVEELLQPRTDLRPIIGIPDDLKIYCFYDRPRAIMQRRMFGQADREKWRFKLWTGEWADMGPVKYSDRYDSALEIPVGAEEVLEAAASLARFVAVPFVRLDFFDTQRGPVFGEVSAHPGPPEQWESSADEMLGWEWEMAEARLLADSISPSEQRPTEPQ